MEKEIVLTGIRPTRPLHIGHYFGALKEMLKIQEDPRYKQYILIADVQALTDNFADPAKVHKNVMQITKDMLSVGIDPTKSTIYIQSMIPQTAELTVFFSNLVTISRLERNPTVKTEIAQKKDIFGESVTYGFLGYPVSQAADILQFNAKIIPVGEDQEPLIEQTREIARKFNSIYGEVFNIPQIKLTKNARIKGLDGNEKMGKSLGNAIFLCDDEKTVEKKVMMALTDPNRIRKTDKGNPQVCMVNYYHKLFSKNVDEIDDLCKEGQIGCVECKKNLIKNINDFLDPIRKQKHFYDENENLVEAILKNGTYDAKCEIEKCVKKVKSAMKLDYFN